MTVRDHFIPDPPSAAIAAELNARGAFVCVAHERDPCYLRCGVERYRETWRVISKERRLEWLRDVEVAVYRVRR